MKTMPISHIFLALLVTIIWGVNFLFIKLGVQEITPLLLCAIRFTLASIPAIFFIKRPDAPLRLLIAYGIIMFAMQFTFMFIGIGLGMTPGMASLIIQTQIFFSLILSSLVLRDPPRLWQVIGALVSFAGIGLIAFHLDNTITVAGFLCLIGAAITWGIGNLITKKVKADDMIPLVVWGSFVAAFPMYLLSLIIDGPHNILIIMHTIDWKGLISISYIVYISTWIGYGTWNWLLGRHSISTIVPFTLLVPIISLFCSAMFMGEALTTWKLTAALLVIGGLCINLAGERLMTFLYSHAEKLS